MDKDNRKMSKPEWSLDLFRQIYLLRDHVPTENFSGYYVGVLYVFFVNYFENHKDIIKEFKIDFLKELKLDKANECKTKDIDNDSILHAYCRHIRNSLSHNKFEIINKADPVIHFKDDSEGEKTFDWNIHIKNMNSVLSCILELTTGKKASTKNT